MEAKIIEIVAGHRGKEAWELYYAIWNAAIDAAAENAQINVDEEISEELLQYAEIDTQSITNLKIK